MTDIIKVADNADMIVSGYAFTRSECGIRVLNLNNPNSAAILSEEGELLATNMSDIETVIMLDHFKRNREYMEDLDAEASTTPNTHQCNS